jgi:hypothetical protein
MDLMGGDNDLLSDIQVDTISLDNRSAGDLLEAPLVNRVAKDLVHVRDLLQ